MSEPIDVPEPQDTTAPEEFVKPKPQSKPVPPRKPRGRMAQAILGPDAKPKDNGNVRPPKSFGRRGQFEQALGEMYVGIGTMMMPFDPVCAQTIIQQAPQCAHALDEAAYQNETVRKLLEGLVTTSVLGMVMVAHAPIMITAMMHHSKKMQANVASGMGDMAEQFLKMQGNASDTSE